MHGKNVKISYKLFNPDKELLLTIRTYDTVSGQCGSVGLTFIHISLRTESVEARQEKGLKLFHISYISAGKMPTSNRLEVHACTV
jgi:hypothetical protein